MGREADSVVPVGGLSCVEIGFGSRGGAGPAGSRALQLVVLGCL